MSLIRPALAEQVIEEAQTRRNVNCLIEKVMKKGGCDVSWTSFMFWNTCGKRHCLYEKGSEAAESWVCSNGCSGENCRSGQRYKTKCQQEAAEKARSHGKCATFTSTPSVRHSFVAHASGVIEGACRHLINDRMDITGARWSLQGAEAILKLRSINSSGEDDLPPGITEIWSSVGLRRSKRTTSLMPTPFRLLPTSLLPRCLTTLPIRR